jgi:hypothetical protein
VGVWVWVCVGVCGCVGVTVGVGGVCVWVCVCVCLWVWVYSVSDEMSAKLQMLFHWLTLSEKFYISMNLFLFISFICHSACKVTDKIDLYIFVFTAVLYAVVFRPQHSSILNLMLEC